MKTFLVLALSLISSSAFAVGKPNVNGARYNAAKQSIDVDVSYGGGCEEHAFKLEIGMCLESFPVQCSAEVLDVSAKPDFCEAFLHQTVSFKLADYGLNDNYFSGALITIGGEGKEGASVRLPRK